MSQNTHRPHTGCGEGGSPGQTGEGSGPQLLRGQPRAPVLVGQGGVGGGVSQRVGLDPKVPPASGGASVLLFKKMDTEVYLIIFIFCNMCPTPLLPWTARFIYD